MVEDDFLDELCWYIWVSFSIQVQYEAEKHKKPWPGCPGGWNFQPLGSQTKLKNPDQLLSWWTFWTFWILQLHWHYMRWACNWCAACSSNITYLLSKQYFVFKGAAEKMTQKLDKVNNSKCELLSDEGGLDFQILPQFKWLKYGLNFDDIWVIYWWDICKIW